VILDRYLFGKGLMGFEISVPERRKIEIISVYIEIRVTT
jgi:hypothetical protein